MQTGNGKPVFAGGPRGRHYMRTPDMTGGLCETRCPTTAGGANDADETMGSQSLLEALEADITCENLS